MKFFHQVILIALLFVITSTRPSTENDTVNNIFESLMSKPPKEIFKVFHLIYKKSNHYELNSEEGIKRYRIFKENLKNIKAHNAKGLSWQEGINEFTDLTDNEFEAIYLMKPEEMDEFENQMKKFSLDDYDDSQDEVKSNSNVKEYPKIDYKEWQLDARSQGRCGSCWAFACASAVETNYSKIKDIRPFYLSTQQLVDCDTRNHGCRGGGIGRAFAYIKNNGLVEDEFYPYLAKRETCQDINKERFKIIGYSYKRNGFDNWYENLKAGASVVVVSGRGMRGYKSGIFKFSEATNSCIGKRATHAMVATGWFYDDKGKAYIEVRNSWGRRWGDNGYIKAYYEPEENNTCHFTKRNWRPRLS